MKNKGLIITLIIVLSVMAVSLTVFMINILNGNLRISKFMISSKISNELVIDKTYDNVFDKININANASDISIKATNASVIRVVIYGNKDKTKIEDINNELLIKQENESCIGFCFNTTISKIEVYLPSNFQNSLFISNNYGDIRIDKLKNANIEVEEDYGDITIEEGNTIKVDNDYGDIKIKNANEINIKASAGDVQVDKASNINIENDYGDIYIKNATNYVNVNDNCGDIKIDNLILNKSSNITNDFGDIKIGSTNNIYIEAKVDLGDIKINKNYRQSDIILRIKNDCGDISVNN